MWRETPQGIGSPDGVWGRTGKLGRTAETPLKVLKIQGQIN